MPRYANDFANGVFAWKQGFRNGRTDGAHLLFDGQVRTQLDGDPWGSMLAVECRGCSYGSVRRYRSGGTAYKAIRRD